MTNLNPAENLQQILELTRFRGLGLKHIFIGDRMRPIHFVREGIGEYG